mmetsp:Transcript_1425/g.6415  ORF Transcript_1425/g.6415 Transcript_1425/m.6415 type:complete len:286 (+) Transcript_1425:864-1721(+)
MMHTRVPSPVLACTLTRQCERLERSLSRCDFDVRVASTDLANIASDSGVSSGTSVSPTVENVSRVVCVDDDGVVAAFDDEDVLVPPGAALEELLVEAMSARSALARSFSFSCSWKHLWHVQQDGWTPLCPPRAATSSLPLSVAPCTRRPNLVFELPRLSCVRSFMRSNTFSWYTSTAEARMERTPGVRISSSTARGNTPQSRGASLDLLVPRDSDRHCRTLASTRHPGGPNIVCVLPLPVWPYANRQTLYPFHAFSKTSFPTLSKTSCCDANGGAVDVGSCDQKE